ncbi:MAG TPA: YceI family protein [Steroidobacteraceae bacterium]|nr:YceI family protein [Steroidobacteraceae bacterium]
MLNRHSWLATLIVLTTIFWHASPRAAEYTIDPSRTLVSFEMRSLGTTQRGEFSGATGTVMLDSAEQRGEIDIVIDARSLKANTAATAKFVSGPSLLNTAVHPQIAYQAQHIVFSGGRPARIEGELTLLGVTRPVALHVSDYDCNGQVDERCTLVATAYVKRSKFGMTRYRMFASDEVKLAIQAEGVSRSTPATRS